MNWHDTYRELEPINKRFTFIYWAGVLGTAVLIGGAVAGGATAASSSNTAAKKTANLINDQAGADKAALAKLNQPVVAPTPEAADMSAQAAVEKQRRMRALAGGKTILTSESPTLSSGAGKSLLGS